MSINTALSNLYAEKSNSEHPLAYWMLNEQVDFFSQITEAQRAEDTDFWTVTNGSLDIGESQLINLPFESSSVLEVIGDIPALEDIDIDVLLQSEDILINFYESDATFAISFYAQKFSTFANQISFGYSYTNQDDEPITDVEIRNIENMPNNQWVYFSHTFPIPLDIKETDKNINIKINFNFLNGGASEEYDFAINGLAVGQLAENFSKTSLGINEQLFTLGDLEDVALPETLKCLKAFPYGLSNKNAYYLASENKIFARNFGVPLVFGSSNITKIVKNTFNADNYPSLIFPGYGFLNETGRHNEYSIEIWTKINPGNNIAKRIFGPILSEDGIYVDSSCISLKIGNSIGSHYVGEWFRPMLIHIRIIQKYASLLLNGEEVIRLEIDQNTLSLPLQYNEEQKNQDWLGFYAYDDISQIEIDNFSIYSYSIPVQVAKRRWVWGQAVVSPEQTNSSLNSTTAFSDYAFANYAVNYNYPDFANWQQAFFSNLNISKKIISLPQYSLPNFELKNQTKEVLFSDIKDVLLINDDPYITLTPNEDWETGHNSDFIYFNKLGILNETVKSIYGIFETDGTEQDKVLLKINNKTNNNNIKIILDELSITYSITINGSTSIFGTDTISSNVAFAVGLDIGILSQIDSKFRTFFSNESLLDIKIAGDGTSKFNGKIYKIGFDAAYNNKKILSLFNNDGIFNGDSSVLYSHTANYTLVVINKYGLLFPDIAIAGYWEDYMPLSYFSKEIEDFDGTKKYELDFIQYDYDFPQPTSITEDVDEFESWSYLDLEIEYGFPTQKRYSTLNSEAYTGWQDYQDMQNNVTRYRHYNTETNQVRSYISFQKITDGANKNLIDFNTIVKPSVYEVIDPQLVAEDWESSVFETTPGSIIYPPVQKYLSEKTVDFNDYAIVYHLEFKTEGILHSPITFKKLQLSSNVLERTDFTIVGSRFGTPIFYYVKDGLYYNIKGKNPIAITKNSTPYLYLDRSSGWTVKGNIYPDINRGIAVPVNFSKSEKSEVSSIQLWIKHNDLDFSADPVLIMSIEHNDGIYDFYVQAEDGLNRGYIFAIDRASLEPVENLNIYINGQNTYRPFIEKEEWCVLGLEFPNVLNFNLITGLITLTGPLTYNNISYNLATNIEKNQILETRYWNEIDALTWDDYNEDTWRNLKIIDESITYVIDPKAIYEKYTGTDRIIVDTGTTGGLLVDPDRVKFYKDVSWSENTKLAI